MSRSDKTIVAIIMCAALFMSFVTWALQKDIIDFCSWNRVGEVAKTVGNASRYAPRLVIHRDKIEGTCVEIVDQASCGFTIHTAPGIYEVRE